MFILRDTVGDHDTVRCIEEYSFPVFYGLEASKFIVRPLLCSHGHGHASTISEVTLQLLVLQARRYQPQKCAILGKDEACFDRLLLPIPFDECSLCREAIECVHEVPFLDLFVANHILELMIVIISEMRKLRALPTRQQSQHGFLEQVWMACNPLHLRA